jgi:hypothetical protein
MSSWLRESRGRWYDPRQLCGGCNAGACAFGGCVAGFGDCDADRLSCETDVRVARDHCGSCGQPCGTTEACVANTCREGTIDWLEVAASPETTSVQRIVRAGPTDLFMAGSFSTRVGIGGQQCPPRP